MRFVTRDLRFRYPAQDAWAIDGVSLDIAPGRVTWLTGALGSGTSTLLLALAGLAPRITGGELVGNAGDNQALAVTPLARGIAYVGPSPSLQISGIAPTVRAEIAVGAMNLGWSRPAILAAVADAMQRMRLEHLAERDPDALSGGETQRMLIAAQLATAPRAWLLDEPFSALDHASAAHVQSVLREQAGAGATVVVACDDADVMLPIADRLIVMRRGRVVLDGDPGQLLAGDAILDAGAGTTDAATLAHLAAMPAPRPVTRDELLLKVAGRRLGIASPGSPARLRTIDPARHRRDASLSLAGVAFGYNADRLVLNDVTLAIRPGEATGLFGSNGAGKSTLLRLAMALEQPTAGTIVTLGAITAGRHPEDFAPRAGFLFQQPERQLFAASVRAECTLAPRLAGWAPARIDAAVATVLDELGLSDTAEEHPYDLSLPRRRLVALAAVLAADPELILLDEPTAALDFASRERVIRVIRERARRGKAILAITHDPGFAHEALDRGVVLDGGKVVQDGSIRGVIDDGRLTRPAALAVALALGLPPGHDRREEVASTLQSR